MQRRALHQIARQAVGQQQVNEPHQKRLLTTFTFWRHTTTVFIPKLI
jgi:hypothetical protein